MTISYNWLKDYINTSLPAEKISEILTDIGLEVDKLEKTETIKGGLEGVVVGEVLTCEKHADADKLKITTVDIGLEAPLQIVCGAPNVASGQKVLVATVGTTLFPSGSNESFKIKKSKIRGVESLGMICAQDELGIGEDHAGIMVLRGDAAVGKPAKEYLGIEDDYVIEIGLTPNRIDAASHYGVARDLAAYLQSTGNDVKATLPSVEAFSTDNTSNIIKIDVQDTEGAPRYAGVTVSDVKIAPSPEWLQKKLRAIGINPKNNVVDITNFVLHETGHPLHAFDADEIDGNTIVVKTYPEGTKFTTLDDVERTLQSDDLIVSSAERPLCLAGVMGGLGSAVSETTRSVFIESAYFNPSRVRRTAKRHGINTDSSFRFERGADPDMAIYALKRAALLMRELAGGQISSDITDIYPEKIEPFRFTVTFNKINSLIGKEIPKQDVQKIVRSLGIGIDSIDDEGMNVAVPPFRVDVTRDVDLIEDILRIYGYNNVEVPHVMQTAITGKKGIHHNEVSNVVSDFFTANGFNEIMSNSLTKSAYYENLKSYPASNSVRIMNPLSIDLNVMRQTLAFNILEAIQLNTNHRRPDLKLYEIGNCYFFDETKKADGGLAPYSEKSMFAAAITGSRNAASWNTKQEPANYFHLRSFAEKIVKRFNIDINNLEYDLNGNDIYRESVSYKLNGKHFITIGMLSDSLLKMFDLKEDVFFMEMELRLLVKQANKNKITVTTISKYPEVKRDLALLVDKDTDFAKLRRVAFSAEKKLLKSVTLFDVYEGNNLPAGKKSYALNFTLEDESKTLTDAIIDKTMKSLMDRFEKECGATVRS